MEFSDHFLFITFFYIMTHIKAGLYFNQHISITLQSGNLFSLLGTFRTGIVIFLFVTIFGRFKFC